MAATRLATPLSEGQVRDLRVGDELTLSGTVWGLRDSTLIHWAEQGYEFPTDGAASVETLQLEEIEAVYWEHLMPECLWKFRFSEFSPLFCEPPGGQPRRSRIGGRRLQPGSAWRSSYQP